MHRSKGVNMSDIPMLEQCFEISLNVFEMDIETGATIPRFLSECQNNDKVHVNMYKNHMS